MDVAPEVSRTPTEPSFHELCAPQWRSIQLSNFTVERIDVLLPDQLDALSKFPRSLEECLRQDPPTLSVSAFSRLYRASSLYKFLEELSHATDSCYGDIQFQLMIARCDITTPEGEIVKAQPVNTFSTFIYEGKRHGGPFFGSLSTPLLQYAPWLSNDQRRAIISDLINETQRAIGVESLTVSFAPADPGRDIRESAAFKIMTHPELGFTLFQGTRAAEQTNGPQLPDHLYYYRGASQALIDPQFIRLLRTIRTLWSKQLVEAQQHEDFREEQRIHDVLRRQYTAYLFGGPREGSARELRLSGSRLISGEAK